MERPREEQRGEPEREPQRAPPEGETDEDQESHGGTDRLRPARSLQHQDQLGGHHPETEGEHDVEDPAAPSLPQQDWS